jgi:rhodanese-related sulfurtransferase
MAIGELVASPTGRWPKRRLRRFSGGFAVRLFVEVSELFDLLAANPGLRLVDVRKPPARAASGHAIPGSVRELPFDVEDWWSRYSDHKVVVYCVHGHEVSQGACESLRAKGIEASYLEGGFEAWREAGLPVEPTGEGQAA